MADSNFNPLDTFEHVVVLMLENRSFDNLLGYLYKDREIPSGKSFDGLQDLDISLPVPDVVRDHQEHPTIKPHRATDYHQPYPDPGEVYQHVNTQIYNFINPRNMTKEACKMETPYNIPDPKPKCPPMTGFINDYVNVLRAYNCEKYEVHHKCKEGSKHYEICKECHSFQDPGYEQYSVIMQCYEPDQVRVLSELANHFAVFDHWFCAVPSQTWCNRAFWHAGTSGGKVINPTDQCGIIDKAAAMVSWMDHVWDKKTLFELLDDNGKSHAIYSSELISLTPLVNGPFKSNNVIRSSEKLENFKRDVKEGNLPHYSFVEPKFIGQHNDQHPSSFAKGLVDGPTRDGSVILGEHLIWDVYSTLRESDYWDKTLFLITYDEHGGCFDHVPPPPCDGNTVLPPEKNMKHTEKDFDFERLGIRVPMIMISAYIQSNTIMNEQFQHTSFIRTMCKKWDLPHLTNRDQSARSFEKVFSSEKREWPKIDEPLIPIDREEEYDQDPLNDLQYSMLVAAYSIACQRQKKMDDSIDLPSIDYIKKVKEMKEYLQLPQIRNLLHDLI